MPIDASKVQWDTVDPNAVQWEEAPGILKSIGAGLGAGVGRTALGAQYYLGKGADAIGLDQIGRWLVDDATQGRAKLAAELQPYKDANPISAGGGQIVGEIAATLPVGGVIAKPVAALAGRVPALAPLADAIASSGMRAGQAAGNAALATRIAGGAAAGGASAALVNPGEGTAGAVVGGALPVVGKVAGYAGNAVGAAARPFLKSGQERIAGGALRRFAADPEAAARSLAGAREIIPGSAPTTAMASGDDGLAGLYRTLQNTPEFAAEASQRARAANAARTASLEAVAATPGKLEAAKAARDAVTDPMREAVLAAAGKLDAGAVAGKIERMLADPNNAGATTRAGLSRALNQIREIAGDTGLIDARALYEIRKDIGLAMNGKLQGEAGNLRFARGALDRVQSLIDDAIEAGGPRPSWRGYLQEYARQSQPINQMEMLADVLRRTQTGTDDGAGNLMLSAANLNNILKNEGAELLKKLSPDQIDLLRRLRADLSAQQAAANAGKPPGSATVQNLASGAALQGLLGGRVAGSQPIQNTIGRTMDWLYKRADGQVVDVLNDAMLNPAEAARLMQQATQPSAVQMLFNRPGLAAIPYRAAPALAAQ